MNELTISNSSSTKITYDILVLDKKLAEFSKSLNFSFDYADRPDFEIDNSEIENTEFDSNVEDSRKLYYLLAVSSGILTGTLSGINLNKFIDKPLALLNNIKYAVIKIASIMGNSPADASDPDKAFSSAVEFIRDKCTSLSSLTSENGFDAFSSNPSLIGLIFSIISALTGKKFGIDNGQFKVLENEQSHIVNFDNSGKLYFAFISWILNLSVAVSKDDNGQIGNGIPKAIMDFAKSVSISPVIEEIKANYNNSVNPLAIKIAEKALNAPESKEWLSQLRNQSIAVVINECIVRASYTLLKLFSQIKQKGIKHIKDINKISVDAIIPVGNRLILRMLTLSTSVFVVSSTAAISIKAAVEAKGDFSTFSVKFLLNLNYAGIARFVLAVKDDKEYIKEDLEHLISEMQKRMEAYDIAYTRVSEAFRSLELSPKEALLSYSLQWQKATYDIQKTSDLKLQAVKQEWLNQWTKLTTDSLHFSEGLVTSSEDLYKEIHSTLNGTKDDAWLHLAAVDLADFNLYTPFTDEDRKKYSKLKDSNSKSYITEVFCKQSSLSKKQLNKISDSRKLYEFILNGTILKAAVGTVAVIAVSAATAGAAAVFAPQIAVAIAGEAVAGLSGAALTNASLAFVGGGAIAAGGLGMAGGTAIITGGGAVLGVICSGTASAAAIGFLSSKKNLINECAKLLAYCKTVLLDYYHNRKAVEQIRDVLACDIVDMEDAINDKLSKMESDTSDSAEIDKKESNASKENLKYVRKTIAELDKLLSGESSDAPEPHRKKSPISPVRGLFDNCKTIEEVEKQYKKLAKIYHPDLNPDDDGVMMQMINEQKDLKIAELNSK